MGYLTAKSVAAMRSAAGKVREIPDGGGLYLLVHLKTARKVWAFRYKHFGRSVKLTLGPALLEGEMDREPIVGAPLSLAGARRLVARLRHEMALGRDPRRLSEASSFAAAAKSYIEKHAMPKARHWQLTARLLGFDASLNLIEGSVAWRWRNTPVDKIDADAVHALIEEVRESGVPGRASRVARSDQRALSAYGALSAAFGWMMSHRIVKMNPMDQLKRPPASRPRDRVLSNEELAAVWAACGSYPFGLAVRLLILTGARLAEVSGMRRSEISGDVWTLPSSRSKNFRAHTVFLAPSATAILDRCPGDDDLIFTMTSYSPISGWSKFKRLLDARLGIAPWRLHDLRRTAASGMGDLGIAPHVIEAVLNHARPGVAGTYNRSRYAAETREAWNRWAEHVAALVG